MDDLKPLIAKLVTGAVLGEDEAERAFDIIMSGKATPAQIGGMLAAMRVRGEQVSELVGAARTMRAKAETITAPPGAVDCCGTGGDGLGTYNVSTAVALVVAAAGIPVAKHGNRAASSKSGAADVLTALGADLDAGFDLIESALRSVNFCFLMAPRHHAAMRHVVPVRTELGSRTIFNLLGPLANPAAAERQLIGVFDRIYVEPLAHVLHGLGARAAWVVHSEDGMDELTVTGASYVAALKDGSVTAFTVTPEDAGLPRHAGTELRGGDAETNAAALQALLRGATGAYRDIVLLNAAAVFIIAQRAETLRDGAALAARLIDSGAAAKVLSDFIAITRAGAALS